MSDGDDDDDDDAGENQPEADTSIGRLFRGGALDHRLVHDPNRVKDQLGLTDPDDERTKETPTDVDRFRLLRPLGQGGMGVVYAALDTERGEHVALKTLGRVTPELLYRLKQEFRALADVRHPNLVRLFELASREDGSAYVTMELVDGAQLLDHARPGGRLAVDAAGLRDLLRQLALGIDALHRADMLHLDIKPSNVMVDRGGRVVLLDFGLVKNRRSDGATTTWEGAGTPAYMSPEQASVDQRPGASADWYGFGAIVYELLTGNRPFHREQGPALLRAKRAGPPRRPVTWEAGQPLQELCLALLDPDPGRRPSGAQVLASLGATASTSTEDDELFVGRDGEQATLMRALQDSRSGPVIVRLGGRSGIGKSALVRTFLRTAVVEHGAFAIKGRCYEHETVPFPGFDSLLDDLAHRLKSMDGRDALALLPRGIASLTRLFPVLARVPVLQTAPGRVAPVSDPHEQRRRAFAALAELLARIADRFPLVLHVDDFQWADVDSAGLLEALCAGPDPPAMLVIVSYRTEDAHVSPSLRALARLTPAGIHRDLELGPLEAEQARELAQRIGSPATLDLTESIVRESGGSPLLIDELVRHAAAASESSRGRVREVELDGMIRARVSALPDDARRLLEVLAVAANPVPREIAATAAGLTGSGREAFDRLRAEHLLRSSRIDGLELVESFHDRVRESVHAGLDDATRRRLHRDLAVVFEAADAPDPAVLAIHWRLADEPVRAAGYARRAADQAMASLAFDRAAELYALALDMDPLGGQARSEVAAARANALAHAGRGRTAAIAFLDAARDSNAEQACELNRRAAEQFLQSGHLQDGERVMEQVAAGVGIRLPRSPFVAAVRYLGARARLAMRGHRFVLREEAEVPVDLRHRLDVCWSIATGYALKDLVRPASITPYQLRLALDAGSRPHLIRALALYAWQLGSRGVSSRAKSESILDILRRIVDDDPDPFGLALLDLVEGSGRITSGDYRKGTEQCDRAAERFAHECVGANWERNVAELLGEMGRVWLGDLRGLCRLLDERDAAARQRGDLFVTVTRRASQSNALRLLALDEPERACAEITDAIAHWSAEHFQMQHHWATQALVQVALYEGAPERAWRLTMERWKQRRLWTMRLSQNMRIASWGSRGACAVAWLLRGDAPRSMLDELRLASREIARERAGWPEGYVLALRGMMAEVAGETATSRPLLRDAIRAYDRFDLGLHAAALRRYLGVLLGGEEGQLLIAQSDAYYRAQGARRPARLAAMTYLDPRVLAS